jgi:hypothetical protein
MPMNRPPGWSKPKTLDGLTKKSVNDGSKFKVGQPIKLQCLVAKPELNGRFGVVQEQLENERYRIMIGENTDLAIKGANLKPLKQCPFEPRLNITGYMVWPHIKGVAEPIMHWVDDQKLTESFVNPFDKKGAFKYYWDQPNWKENHDFFISPVVHDCLIGSEKDMEVNRSFIMRDYETRLKKLLNWKDPIMWLNTSGASDNNQMCVYWDAASKAPINDSIKVRLPGADSQGCVPEMRGPVIYIEALQAKNIRSLKDAVAPNSLNWQKAEFYLKRYHKVIWCDIEDKKAARMQKKSDLRILKVQQTFPVCRRPCKVCRNRKKELERRIKDSEAGR